MKKNDLLKTPNSVYRVLNFDRESVFAIDCYKKTMPKTFSLDYFKNAEPVATLFHSFKSFDKLTPSVRKVAQERYTMIAGALYVLDNTPERNRMIKKASEQFNVSKQTIRLYLCTYLVYQDLACLAPKERTEKELNIDQKNMRWALNKFFYTRNQNSLKTAYTMMLKEKYCDEEGVLLPEYPSFNQFRYFYRKNKKIETFYISREGLKNYQRNNRPLLGDGVQEFAPTVGTAMLDGTVCDIYLVDDKGQLIGRPVLVVACDANTSMCLGYALLWESGTYSLQTLMLNIIEDKVTLCERLGINITPEQWAVNQLPGVMVTDGGCEYTGKTFEQITELGVTLIKLPSYRPELKGTVEKFFDIVQNLYKDALKGKGVIMPDFQERGSHDYRKDAVLTLQEFERIVVGCIIYYNSERVLQNYPYTEDMLENNVKPYANEIWNYKKNESGANLISINKRDLTLTLLPHIAGKFTRFGLKVNKLRYYNEAYKEQFLQGGEATVAFNPDDCGKVWLKETGGSYVEFELIESRFKDMSLETVQEIQRQQKEVVKSAVEDSYQAKIELLSFIESVSNKEILEDVKIDGIRKARNNARRKQHIDLGGNIDE